MWDRDNLFVGASRVYHVDDADGVHVNQRHAVYGLGADYENVERVIVLGVGAGDKAVICRIVGGSV